MATNIEIRPNQKLIQEGAKYKDREPFGNLVVMKFGGTSVGNAEAIEKAVEIVKDYRQDGISVVVVVSAMSGVTNKLIELYDSAVSGNREKLWETIKGLWEKHMEVCFHLNINNEAIIILREKVSEIFGELINDISTARKDFLEDKDKILSYGERINAEIVSMRLGQAEALDSSKIIETDGHFGDASPDMEKTRVKVRGAISEMFQRGITPVAAGFIGSTEDGKRTTLGRGGSDYTASIIGWALGVKEVIIWTDVDGVYSSDPRIDPNARLISEMSLEEADGIAKNGAKVLYPKTVEPFIRYGNQANTVIWVKSTFDPKARGTRIADPSQLS